MEALRSSASLSPALKLVSETGVFSKRKEALFLRPFSVPHNHVDHLCFSVSKPLYKKRPIFPFSSLSSSDTQMQLDIQDEETKANDLISQIKTVRVRFQLQRECSFGQQFHIVGDDPVLGQWDPSGAVPFNWSGGHVWTTTELDVPIGKCINFKIILKEGPENITWQPGPDRILQTWETDNVLTICEDWDSADCHKILEDNEPTFNQIEESIINAEDITYPEEEVHIDKSNTMQSRGLVSNEKESPAVISDEDYNLLMLGDGSMMNVEDSKITKDETVSTNGLPLLVPGLNPLPTTQPDEEVLNEVKKNILTDASIEADKFKELKMPELKLEQVLDNDYREEHQHIQVENPQFAEDEDQQNLKSYDLVLENDNRWGLSTLQKLFANFIFE